MWGEKECATINEGLTCNRHDNFSMLQCGKRKPPKVDTFLLLSVYDVLIELSLVPLEGEEFSSTVWKSIRRILAPH